MKINLFVAIFLSIIVFAACKTTEVDNLSTNTTSTYGGTGSVTQGIGKTTNNSLYSCSGGRVTSVGTITSTDGKVWTIPAETDFSTPTKLTDLFNECTGAKPTSISQVDLSKVPTVVIDADGEVIIGYIHGDNYYELYVNGKLVGVDAVPYTPFNSSVVKFKAKRPIKYAVKLVDWEENLGIGSEANGGNAYYPGDGGFIAKFSDGTSTSSAWKAQTFYIAPLADINCVSETGSSRISSSCSNSPNSGAKSYALHWEIPSTWYTSDYDFSKWPSATTFTEAQVGVKPAYLNFTSSFAGSQFIWSSNLVLDNLVLLRFTAK